ncbi:MAG TPA: universal stress protein [Solirubrobacteraceae bacterium]|nr:universal stress protein [Solirubrobacteraceae bacterium]
MTPVLIAIIAILAAALVGLGLYHHGVLRRHPSLPAPEAGSQRILFPFVGRSLSGRALDAALRLARAEGATLMPVFLARVPLTLPLNSPLPRQAAVCLPLQEAIEHRAADFGVPVDARVERGRTYRHALRRTIATERFERIVMAAAGDSGPGFGPDDVAWLLATAPGEIVVLRPGAEDQQLLPSPPRPQRVAVSESSGAPARERDPVPS